MRPVTLMDVRQALRDPRFRDLFPELGTEMVKYAAQTHCGSCAVPLTRKVMAEYSDRVATYFPGREIVKVTAEETRTIGSRPSVYNGPCSEVENWLRKLPHVPSQVTAARWQDQCTVIVFEES